MAVSLAQIFNLSHPDNPVVFFDIKIGDYPAGQIKMELFANIVPKTAENFRQLCTGQYRKNGKPMGYKGCSFHRIVKNFMVQSGDFINNDGSGSFSIYGETFPDENFNLKHNSPGLLSMANSGPHTNGCQFFITSKESEYLDGKHVVFGRVTENASMVTVRKIENVPVDANEFPKIPVIIMECGEL